MPKRYAEVAVNAPVHNTFHYHIPDELRTQLLPGHLVRVAFGTAMQVGIVVQLLDETDVPETKPILNLIDHEPVLTPLYIELARWMSAAYQASLVACLWWMLPAGISGQGTWQITLQQPDADVRGSVQQAIIEALREADDHSLRITQLEHRMGRKGLLSTIRNLEKAGIVSAEPFLMPPRIKPKTIRTAVLAIPYDEALQTRLGKAEQRIVDYLAECGHPVEATEIYQAANASSSQLNNLEAKGVIHQVERLAWRDPLGERDYVPSAALKLTPEQDTAWQVIRGAMVAKEHKRFLLHGVTGSGKTEIYLYAIAQALEQGQQAMLLVPEIGLTEQTIERVERRFPGVVGILHSRITSKGERYDTWHRARRGDIRILIGTRSALSVPMPELGLIILDEEHDASYKQDPSENTSFDFIPYHARDIAEELMHLHDGVLILGSATPDLSTFYRAQQGDLVYLQLPSRIMGHRQRVQAQSERAGVHARYQALTDDTTDDTSEALMIDLPPVEVVDMRDELKAGNRSMFSRVLHDAISDVLSRGEQAILFLNRRGQATYVFCRDCGYVLQRDDCGCGLPLTYHRHGEDLRCHHCNYHMAVPTSCPNCESTRIKYFGAGTQQVEQAVQQTFPQARMVRFDADTVADAGKHEAILRIFKQQQADILVGTQMIAKGHDLPMVTLVGVISADPGLNMPDFRASERGFQLLTQVAGRAGRGVLGGRVILQTYDPQHASVRFAAQHDYHGFYEVEIAARRQMGYPPFRRLARVLVTSTHPVEVERQANRVAHILTRHIEERQLTDTTLIGPAPCFFQKLGDSFRWHVIIRSNDPLNVLRDFPLAQNWYLDIDPVNLL